MAREIKFRGKRLDNGKWMVGDRLENQGRLFIYQSASYTTIKDKGDGRISVVAVQVDPNTVGQFTGEYDAEGTEIYEGDLVLYPECVENDWESFSRPVYAKTPHQVIFSEGGFWLVGKYPELNDPIHLNDMSGAHTPTVYGNIHDNIPYL